MQLQFCIFLNFRININCRYTIHAVPYFIEIVQSFGIIVNTDRCLT
jgi:hypothetical protein